MMRKLRVTTSNSPHSNNNLSMFIGLLVLFAGLYSCKSSPTSALQRAAAESIPEGGWTTHYCSALTTSPFTSNSNSSSSSGNINGHFSTPLQRIVVDTHAQLKKDPALFAHKLGGENNTNNNKVHTSAASNALEWAGIPATPEERMKVDAIRTQLKEAADKHPWLSSCHDAEVLRFLRKSDGRLEEAVAALRAHAQWRRSRYGADTVMREASKYARSNIHREIFWLGVSREGCPTLVIRTQAHDGADYNEDPHQFTAVLTQILETGRALYGVGVTRQVCLLLDRGHVPPRAGASKKKSEMDMSVIPNLINLYKHVYGTVMAHYPELLLHALIVPSSWFFSVCYKLTAVVMDSGSRSKFRMVRADQVPAEMAKLFPREQLPPHLGGTSTSYGPPVE